MSFPKAKVGVIFYSTYGHVGIMAEKIIEGAKSSGAEVLVYQFQETLPEEVLTKMHAGSSLKPKYPIITPAALAELDGFLLGFPTRYGRAPAPVSAFFDATGQLWATGALQGKFAALFTSTAGQHGGQETTALTTLPWLAHQGLIYVPFGYRNPNISLMDSIQGGSPWGSSTIANSDGSRMPSEPELNAAEDQGGHFAKIVQTFIAGKTIVDKPTPSTGTAAPLVAPETTPATKQTDEPKAYDVPPTKETSTTAAAPVPAKEGNATTAGPSVPTNGQNSATAGTQKKSSKGGLWALCCGKGDSIE